MDNSVYIHHIVRRMDEFCMTIPKDEEGTHFHEAFISYLKLVYSPQDAAAARRCGAEPDGIIRMRSCHRTLYPKLEKIVSIAVHARSVASLMP